MSIPSTIEAEQVDDLFLLVGTNPLPNLVAARLLARPGATVWLLYTDRSPREPGTKHVAERLEDILRAKCPELAGVRLEAIPSAESAGIEDRVRQIAGSLGSGRAVGLNYSGGTKPMSVHTYRTLESHLKERRSRLSFSYLDPRHLALRIDGGHVYPILGAQALRQRVEFALDDLADLHGYGPVEAGESWAEPDSTPGLAELCADMAQLHTSLFASQDGMQAWRAWIREGNCVNLPDDTTYPRLKPLREALDRFCGGPGQATPHAVARRLLPNARPEKQELKNCSLWFAAVWLEQHKCALYASDGLCQRAHLEGEEVG